MEGRTLTEGTPWKGILSFTFPILMGLLLQQLYNTVDTIVVGNFAGEAPLAAGIFVSPFALKYILATPDSLLSMADTYFKIYAAGLICQFGYNIVAAILRGVGNSKATLYFLLIASGINIVLDIVFVYSLDMGVAGAAIATDIAQAASCFAAIIYMIKKYPLFRWKLKELTFEIRLPQSHWL